MTLLPVKPRSSNTQILLSLVNILWHADFTTMTFSQILPGEYGFIVRLIEGRDIKKRPTEYRMDKVLQPFDEKKFNFTKIPQAEAICRFEESEQNMTNFLDAAPILTPDSVNIIAINVCKTFNFLSYI